MSVMNYLIWSNEHGAWWGPNGHGYTTGLETAGRYSKERAERIAQSAGCWGPNGEPNEVAVVAPEHSWHGGGG